MADNNCSEKTDTSAEEVPWRNQHLAEIQDLKGIMEIRKFCNKINQGRKPFKVRKTACCDTDSILITEKGKILER